MKLYKKLSMLAAAVCMSVCCAVNVSAYDVEHYQEYGEYYTYSSPYYDALVNICGGAPYLGGTIGIDEYSLVQYADGIMSVQFVDMDKDGTKEMIVLAVDNLYYYDEYHGNYEKDSAWVYAYVFTISNGKAVCIYEDTSEALEVYAGLNVSFRPVFSLSERNGKTYFIKTTGTHEGGVLQNNLVMEKQGVAMKTVVQLRAMSDMLTYSYYINGCPVSAAEHKASAEKYLKYNGIMENVGSFNMVDPYHYGISSYIGDTVIPELYSSTVFENIAKGIY